MSEALRNDQLSRSLMDAGYGFGCETIRAEEANEGPSLALNRWGVALAAGRPHAKVQIQEGGRSAGEDVIKVTQEEDGLRLARKPVQVEATGGEAAVLGSSEALMQWMAVQTKALEKKQQSESILQERRLQAMEQGLADDRKAREAAAAAEAAQRVQVDERIRQGEEQSRQTTEWMQRTTQMQMDYMSQMCKMVEQVVQRNAGESVAGFPEMPMVAPNRLVDRTAQGQGFGSPSSYTGGTQNATEVPQSVRKPSAASGLLVIPEMPGLAVEDKQVLDMMVSKAGGEQQLMAILAARVGNGEGERASSLGQK